ncbi:MAG: 2Fe-2S iron-sulfur cluster-binding protein [Nocardioides sp.]
MSSMELRLGPRPGEVLDRRRPLTLSWNGRTYPAYDGDTIASALAACGVRVFSRSFKYHRPRGLLTANVLDPGCVVSVDGEPNVRGAHRLVTDGDDVRSQDTWPSLGLDVKAATGLVGRFLPPGFYYKTFMAPQPLWPAYERVLQRFAHGGALPAQTPVAAPAKRHVRPDVLVAGGGPAGMVAALVAAEAGASVLLVEEEHALGGHLRWGGTDELAVLDDLRSRVLASGVEVLTDSVALGRYDGNDVPVVQRGRDAAHERLVKARPRVLVYAPGLIERPYIFAGNDVPGVMLATAARRLVNLYAVRPGWRAVVFTANDEGDAAVHDLERAGVEVVHVEDARRGGELVRVRGRSGVRSVEVSDRTVECDLVVTATGWTTPSTLVTMAGGALAWDRRAARFVPDPGTLPYDVLVTGRALGGPSPDDVVAHAEATGREAARRAAYLKGRERASIPTRPQTDTPAPATRPGQRIAVPRAVDHPALFHARTHGIVDFSEDVSSHDLVAAVREGYDSVELAKRYTTATMGPAQGKLESVNVAAVVAEATGQEMGDVGTTTWRPPYAAVTLGALAGPERAPVRRSPMHDWHRTHRAVSMLAGAWVRPDHYGDPAGEALAVRRDVGIIDVTPIGKLDLQGLDVPKLLNLLYVNRWSKLEVGRVRYGVMCAEDGVILDDGVTGRLGEDHYLMSTTSSGAATVWEWMELWLQTEHPDWQVHVTPVTTAYASINVAGPRSRELVARVTEGVDVGGEAFPYLHVRTGRVAGVDDCVLWRIGFTGELSYELHVPAGYGLHVWERLIETGADLGVRPFGVEAQRILRLEKGHLIVGQDTDGLTSAYDASLDGLVKLDKDDFAGLPVLARQAREGHDSRLVGLRFDDSVLPAEGCQVVGLDDMPRGRVTSARMSPTLGRPVCLGLVATDLAEPGTALRVRLTDGRTVPATVTETLAQVDPEGVRLRG